MEKPMAVQKIGTARFFQISKFRVAFFRKVPRGPKSWNRPFLKGCEAWRCLIQKSPAVEQVGTTPLFRLSFPGLLL